MELHKIGEKIEFVNNFRGNRSGFVHESTLFLNGVEVASAKCQYYNRTWECYTYQTVMKKCLENYIEEKQNRKLLNFKYEHNIDRFAKGQKQQILEDYDKTEEMQLLRNAYNTL